MSTGLPPLSPAGPGQPIDEARHDVLSLLSAEAKALVLGELMDLRGAVVKADALPAGGAQSSRLRLLDAAIRRVVRGLYRYETRRIDQAAGGVDFDPTTGWGATL